MRGAQGAARRARRAPGAASTPAKCPTSAPTPPRSARADWRVAPAPADLPDRRVEITGPTNAKMVINALNSGASVFMADFEDATAPAFDTLIDGQANLIDRWRGTLAFDDPATGKSYRVGDDPAVLIVRPRGLHLDEAHVTRRRRAAVGVAVRFRALPVPQCRGRDRRAGRGPISICPSSRARREAAWWSEVIAFAEAELGLPRGTVRVTLLIETLARGVRDGRDAVRAEGPCRRAQLRALGLYLQLHQALRADGGAARPRPLGDDDGSRLPRRLFAAPDRHLPPPRRACDGRDGGGDPGQGRRSRQCRRVRARRRRQAPRSRQRP